MQRGEIYLASFPYGDVATMKLRQPDHQSTRLKTVSVLRLHKLATIHVTSVQRYVGKISTATQQTVDGKLREVLSL
jgi:mRNA-degrading endonuclease toxin of MazEF toxin-antitoxin module